MLVLQGFRCVLSEFCYDYGLKSKSVFNLFAVFFKSIIQSVLYQVQT